MDLEVAGGLDSGSRIISGKKKNFPRFLVDTDFQNNPYVVCGIHRGMYMVFFNN